MKNTDPILDVVIVAYKSRNEILPCVRSIPSRLLQCAVSVTVIDNSRAADGVPALLAQEAPSVQSIVPACNLGFGRANNLGFSHGSAPHVLFLNPDTISNEAALSRCLHRLLVEEDIGLISPKLVLADGSMDLACRRSIPTLWDGFCRAAGLAAWFPRQALFSRYNLTHLPVSGTYDVGAINGAFMMGRRSFLSSISNPAPSGVFDERFFMYGDDLDLCIRVSRAGKRIVYDGAESIVHLKGTSVGKEYDSMSEAIFDANRDVYLKHFNPRGSRLVRLRYQLAFGCWKRVAKLKAQLRGHKKVRPL